MRELRDKHSVKAIVSGGIGPRGDGYKPGSMTVDEAEAYHNMQISTFKEAQVDLIMATTMNYLAEALGLVKAARHHQVPVVVSFTVETDGDLPTGMSV
jgi:homocysteine S-methyltransferase